MAKCGACDGHGHRKCPKCAGKGRVSSGGILPGGTVRCNNCDGSGVVKCGACRGKGYV
jgi:hypothetical protein